MCPPPQKLGSHVCPPLPTGQDGTLQSFSTVHERFNKNLGHGEFPDRYRLRTSEPQD